MSDITTINGSDRIKDSRAVINANFQALNEDKLEEVSENLRLTDSIQVGEDEDHPVFGAGGNLVSMDTEANGNGVSLKTDLFSEPHQQQYSDSDGRIPVVTVAEIPPPDAPVAVGIFYVDTVAGKSYVSIGTATVADWKLLNTISAMIFTGRGGNLTGNADDTIYADSNGADDTETVLGNFMTGDHTIKNLVIDVVGNTVDDDEIVFTLFKNGSPTGITVTVAAMTDGTFQDTTHTVDVEATDRITIEAAAGGSTGDYVFSFSYEVL